MKSYLTLILLLVVIPATAAADDPQRLPTLTSPAAADTTPSNLWVAQALIADVAREVAAALPGDPARILLRPEAKHDAATLFQESASDLFTLDGHELFLDETNVVKQGTKAAAVPDDVDVIISYRVEDMSLTHPETGRRFGLWRQWVGREMQLIMLVRVLDAADGRLRMDDRLVRRYVDRVPSGRFDAIASPAYTFTHADATSNGMRGIMENLVVIGSLAGLVAIYFANSGN